jgi:valyl-tRNA synthetase
MGFHEDMPENQGGQSIMYAPWPKPLEGDFRDHYGLDDCYIEIVDAKYELVTQGRNLRREANIPFNKKVKFIFKPSGVVPPNDLKVLELLLNAEALVVDPDYQARKGTPIVHSELGELSLPLEGLIDLAAEKARLTKELEKAAAEIVKVEQKLNNPAFVTKVPPQILEEHQKRLADWQTKQAHLQRALEGLSGS